jgi:bifunctional UDP-N-acetylglucosamine pyrophosphorylase / glucosamine-1-phosphate N-acetyltransferase
MARAPATLRLMAAPTVVIMAAGYGTRMRSTRPKVLHPICGLPMVEWVVAAARTAGAGRIVCVTRPDSGVAEVLGNSVEIVEQREGEGTGAAVLAARDHLRDPSPVVILSGDHPLISAELVSELAARHERDGAAATVLTTDQLDPTGYGRVVRDEDGGVERIVETKHSERASPEELAIREINIGTYAFSAGPLLAALDAIGESGGERYLTGVIPVLRERGLPIAAHPTNDTLSAMGVNTHLDLMNVERIARRAIVDTHALEGVSFESPDTACIDAGVQIGEDTSVAAGVTLRGSTAVGAGCVVGPQTTITDSRIGDRVSVLHSYLDGCEVDDEAKIGPFAYLRPGTRVGRGARIGTFVEVKNANIGAGAKVPHLSYIGDADVGDEANVAAGNITANYDGRRKHRTVIGKRAKTGVHTSYVAPVRIGEDAYTGAGSVIDEDVPDGALGIARAKQTNVEGYAKRVEEESGE